MPQTSSTKRIACVQHGDYAAAVNAMRSGLRETYQAQFYTVDAFEKFISAHPHLVVCIGDRDEVVKRENGLIATVQRPTTRLLPGRVREALLWRKIKRQLDTFAPTHLVVRVTHTTGVALLRYASSRDLQTACIIASAFDPGVQVNRDFCRLASAGNVNFVANHLRVATQSLVDCGLRADKALAFDYPVTTSADDYSPKTLKSAGPYKIVFAGVLSEPKGAGDLLNAFVKLVDSGLNIELCVCGDGAMKTQFEELSRRYPTLKVMGRVPQGDVIRLMRDADVVVVPSRSTFAEGLPLTLLEGLAVRTPVAISSHPVFTKYFQSGQGVIVFPEANPDALASCIRSLLSDADLYASISLKGAAAWRSVQEPSKFHHLLERLSTQWVM